MAVLGRDGIGTKARATDLGTKVDYEDPVGTVTIGYVSSG